MVYKLFDMGGSMDLIINTMGILFTIAGTYFLAEQLFISNIKQSYMQSGLQWENLKYIDRIIAKIFRINKSNITDLFDPLKLKNIIKYRHPFYGFILFLLGSLLQMNFIQKLIKQIIYIIFNTK